MTKSRMTISRITQMMTIISGRLFEPDVLFSDGALVPGR